MCVDLFVLALLKTVFLYLFLSHASSIFQIHFQKASFCPLHGKQTFSINSLAPCHFWKWITSANYCLPWFTVATFNYTQASFCCLMIKVHFPEWSRVITSFYDILLLAKKRWHFAPSPPWLGFEAGPSDKAMSSAHPCAAEVGGKSYG